MTEQSRGRYRLTVRLEFSAAHQLRHYQGKCEALHGHNFGVEVVVEGRQTDAKTGMLLDFGILKAETREVLAGLDHMHLNDLPAFAQQNPSSEHLARYIYQQLAGRLAALPQAAQARVAQVTVSEKAAQSATYLED